MGATVRTRYCSHACNRKGYKKTERDQKLGAAKALIRVEPLNLRHDPVNWEELTRKPYLTVSEACLVLATAGSITVDTEPVDAGGIRPKIAPKSIERYKTKVREITSRSRPI